tara:strand:- start:460 stop:1032 length:573 start_codon:yes stop_codon:yes gene_type:complete
MNIIKFSFKKFTILIFIGLSIFPTNKVKSAEEIKIVYSIFSRTINVKELKEFALYGEADKNLRRLLKLTNTQNDEIKEILRKEFQIPLSIASKLMYSEIGNVILTRLSKIIHPPNARDEKTAVLALRSSVIKGIDIGDGKINTINFFEGYPTKKVILNVNALSRIMNKVESIAELLKFFTNSPLTKIKTD